MMILIASSKAGGEIESVAQDANTPDIKGFKG